MIVMTKETRYSTKRDYIPELVGINAKLLSQGKSPILEGSPEYNKIKDILKNRSTAKRTVGVAIIQELVKDYEPDNKEFEITEGARALGIEKERKEKFEHGMFG